MGKSVVGQAKSGFKWDLIGTIFKQLGVLAVTVVLARILSPHEFGIVGLAMAVVGFSQLFVDIGFMQGLIQSKDTSSETYSSVFFVNIILGALMSILIFISANHIGIFYENKELSNVIKWLSIIPFISSLGSVQNTIFVKNLEFKILALRIVLGTIMGGVVGVLMAYMGHGVYALVGQQLTTAIVLVITLWWKSMWRPTIYFSYQEIKEIFRFSSFVFIDNLTRRLFMHIDTLFVGKVFTPATLGLYSRAASLNSQLTEYTTSSLRKVLFPAFSKLQDDKRLFELNFMKVYHLSAAVGVLVTGCLYFLANDLILFLLGEKWQPAVIIFQILLFKALFSPFGSLIGKALLAKGYSKQNMILGFARRLVLLVPIVIGYAFGNIISFTLALAVFNGVAFLISLAATHVYLKISFQTLLIDFVKSSLLLIIWLMIFFIDTEMNGMLIASVYLVTQLIYLYGTNNKGFEILLKLVSELVRNKSQKKGLDM